VPIWFTIYYRLVFWRKALPPWSPVYLLNGIVSYSTKVLLLMLFVCDIVGHFLGYLLIMFAAVIFQFLMHLAALMVPFLPSDIMTLVILLHLSCMRFVTMLGWTLYPTTYQREYCQQFVLMMLALIFALRVSVEIAILMSMFLIL